MGRRGRGYRGINDNEKKNPTKNKLFKKWFWNQTVWVQALAYDGVKANLIVTRILNNHLSSKIPELNRN